MTLPTAGDYLVFVTIVLSSGTNVGQAEEYYLRVNTTNQGAIMQRNANEKDATVHSTYFLDNASASDTLKLRAIKLNNNTSTVAEATSTKIVAVRVA